MGMAWVVPPAQDAGSSPPGWHYIFRLGDPNLNLHLPLAKLGVLGGQPTQGMAERNDTLSIPWCGRWQNLTKFFGAVARGGYNPRIKHFPCYQFFMDRTKPQRINPKILKNCLGSKKKMGLPSKLEKLLTTSWKKTGCFSIIFLVLLVS